MRSKPLMLFTVVLMSVLCMLSACEKRDVSKELPEATAGQATQKRPCIEFLDTETEFGLITVPHLDFEKASDDIVSANEMFESVRDHLLANIEEFRKMTDEEPPEIGETSPLCTCTYSETNSILSILVKYEYYFAAPQVQIVTVNVNIETGELIEPQDVIDLACYTESEVEAALRCYAEKAMFTEWEHQLGYEFASRQERIIGIGDPTPGWFEQLDDMIASYKTKPQPTGEKWDDLPIYPLVYLDEFGRLFVGADIPTLAGAGYWTTMVCIGHSDADTLRLNPNNPYGLPFGRGMMSEDAACGAVAFTMGLDENGGDDNGTAFSLSAERMELVDGGSGVFEPCYLIRAFTDEDDHIATQGWWAVEPFSGSVYEMDLDGSWMPRMNGTGVLPEAVFTGARMKGAMATIYNEPSNNEIWAADPVYELDLVPLDGVGQTELGAKTALLFASHGGTTVTVEAGAVDSEGFKSQKQLFSVELEENQSVLMHLYRPEGMPSQAITVFTGADNAVYIIVYDGKDGTAKVEYIIPESANG